MTSTVLIFLIIFGAIGFSLFFIGWLFAFLTALGNKRYAFGTFSALLPPVALVYCALHWQQASHAGKMLYAGTAILLILLAILYYFSFQLHPNA